MIFKNNNDNLEIFEDHSSIKRKQIGQRSINSFEKILLASAESMIKNGDSIDKVAKSFSMSKNDLQDLMNSPTKEKKIEKKTKKVAKKDNSANEAYENLYGNGKANKTPKQSFKTSKSIVPSRSAETDEGITNNNLKSKSTNSIWEPDFIEKRAKIKGNDERLKAINKKEKQRREELKNATRNELINDKDLQEALNNNELKKENSISKLADANDSYNYDKHVPQNGMSIFDNGNFDKIAKKTKGEKIKGENLKRLSKKDRSWTKSPEDQQVSSNKIFENMINNMINHEEK